MSMTHADKLKALESKVRDLVECPSVILVSEISDWADELAAIRAELVEAVPVAELFVSERGMHAETRVPPGTIQHGRHLLYTAPPASVPVEALRELAERWVPDESEEEETEFDRGYEQALDECKADLTALIEAQEKP